MMSNVKPVTWVDTSLADVKEFPAEARRKVGFQLDKVQNGENPDNWKPFSEIGAGVQEIRISEDSGIYRVMYVAKFEESVYVLHAFQKKTQTTSKHDKDLAKSRYQQVLERRRNL